MENQVFRIDTQQLEGLKRKAFFRLLKIIIPIWLLIGAIQYLQWGKGDLALFSLIFMGMLPFLIFPVWIGTKGVKRILQTHEIILDSQGIEARAEMSPYKKNIMDKFGI